MKKQITMLVAILLLSVAFVLGGCTDPYSNVRIDFSAPSIEIVLGVNENDTTSILATVSGFNSGASNLIMFSPLVNNVVVTSVTSLGNGMYRAYVKGIQPGVSTIKVTTLEGNKSSFFSVTVVQPIQSFALQSSISPYILKKSGEEATRNLANESLFNFFPNNTTQKQISFALKDPTLEGASLVNGILSLSADFEFESVAILATSFFNADLVREFIVKIVEPIEESNVYINGAPMALGSQLTVVANSLDYSVLNITVEVDLSKQVEAQLYSNNMAFSTDGNLQITKNVTNQENVFSWNIWIKTLGSHQLSLKLFYGGFLYEKVFSNSALIVNVVNQPTDVLIDNVSLTEKNTFSVFNKYAPLLLGTMFQLSVSPFNVLPAHAAITLSQAGKQVGENFTGIEIYSSSGVALLVGAQVQNGASVFVRGRAGETGVQNVLLTCASIFEGSASVTRTAIFNIYEGIDEMEGGGPTILEITGNTNQQTRLSFNVFPAISIADGFGISVSNANLTVSDQMEIGELVVFGDKTWRTVYVPVTPKVEGNTTVVVYSGNGYYVNYSITIITRIIGAAFRTETMEENADVRKREMVGLVSSGLQTLEQVVMSSASTGVALSLVKLPSQARATVEYVYCDYILNTETKIWELPPKVDGKQLYATDSDFITITNNKIVPININGGKTKVKAFVKTTIVNASGISMLVYLSPLGEFFQLVEGSYYNINTGIAASDSYPAWYEFNIETFVPISKIVINKTSATLSSLNSVGYYNQGLSQLGLSITVFPSNATHKDNIVWSANRSEMDGIYRLFSFSPSENKLSAAFIAESLRAYELYETVRLRVRVTELGDRVFEQYCEITWKNEEIVSHVALHNASITDGIYIENLPGQTTSFTLLATAYPTSAFNRNLRYSFEPDGMTSSNFISVNPTTGKIEVLQSGSGRGVIVVAPEDRFQNHSGFISPIAQSAFDDCIVRIPILVVDGSQEEFAIRIFESSKFETMRNLPKLFYVLCADITLTNFNPINKFLGSLNGTFRMPISVDQNGNTVFQSITYTLNLQYTSNVELEFNNSDYYGLLFNQLGSSLYADLATQTTDSTIKNLFVTISFDQPSKSFVNGAQPLTVGGLVGKNIGQITNVKIVDRASTQSIFSIGTANTIGAFAGENVGIINNVSSTLNLSANANAGGLVGNNLMWNSVIVFPTGETYDLPWEGTITNARNMGTVTGMGVVGGIAAYNSAKIENAFFETLESSLTGLSASAVVGTVGSSHVGGLVGVMTSGTLSLSYFTSYKFTRILDQTSFFGDIVAQSGNVGGLIGSLNNGTINQCFVSATILAQNATAFAGGLFGEMGNSEEEDQPDVFNVYTLGTYQAANAGAFVGNMVSYENVSTQVFVGSVSNAYSLSTNLLQEVLTGIAETNGVSEQDIFIKVFTGAEAIKTLQNWQSEGWSIQDSQDAPNAIWSYGIEILLQVYPFLTYVKAPVAPTEINNIIFGSASESFVPFKKGGASQNNAVVAFYYEPLTLQNLSVQSQAKIAQLNTISLAWSIDGNKVLLGSLLSFEAMPANASKLFEHYNIVSSNTNAIKINSNSSMQMVGVGISEISIVSKLNPTVFATVDVEVLYPQGEFNIYLGANSQNGLLIKNGNILKIKRTYSQNITSSYSSTKVVDGVSIVFKVENATLSFADSIGNKYGTENSNLSVTNSNLGVHTVQGNISSEGGNFVFVSTLQFTRSNISADAKLQVTQLLKKTFFINVWTGAESVLASQGSFDVEPIIAPVFEFSVISDANEIIEGDDIAGTPATYSQSTILINIDQSHEKPVIFGQPIIRRVSESTDEGNGFSRIYFSLELTYLSDWHKALITENMSYTITISSKTANNLSVFAVVTVVVMPQTLHTVSLEHYYSNQVSLNYTTGISEYEFVREPSPTIVPGSSGLIAIEMFPFYSSWDSLSIVYKQQEGKPVNFEPLERLSNGLFVPSGSVVYQILDDGILVQKQSITETSINTLLDGQKEVGIFYARLLIGTNISRDTLFKIEVEVFYQGINVGSQFINLTAQYLPGATFEIDGVAGDGQLLARAQDYNLNVVLIGEDRLGDIEIIGDSENFNPAGYSATNILYKVSRSATALPVPVTDPLTNQIIGTSVSMTLTIGVLCEQTKDSSGNNIDDGFVTIKVTTSRIVNGQEEQKDSSITFKVVDYIIEDIGFKNSSPENTIFSNSVEIDKKLEFDFSFKGIDKQTGYYKYTNQTLDGTAARQEELNALAEHEALRNSLSNQSPKNGLFVVNGNTESSLVINGNINNAVSSRFTFREDYEEDVFTGFIITGRNQSTTTMRFKQEQVVPGNITLVHIFNFTIEIGLYTDEDKPALIYTYDDLVNAINGIEAQNYILMADIVLPADFVPFANTSKISSLDGNNKIITFLGFAVPKSQNPGDLKALKFSLFEVVSLGTIIKNLYVDLSSLPVMDLEGTNIASLIFAPFAITNAGIITNCHVQNFSAQPFIVSQKGNIQISSVSVSSDSAIYMSGFVRTNTDTGSITNSSFGGSGALLSPRGNVVKREISIVGRGNIAGFVNENNGRIIASSAINFNIVNDSISTQSVYSAGFVGNNSGTAQIVESQAKDVRTFSTNLNTSGIASMGIRAGFAFTNSGKIQDCHSNFNFTTTNNTIGGYTAGFVYRNNASGVITTTYANTVLNTALLGQSEFSGIDDRARSLNEGSITFSYYYSRSATGAMLNNEDAFQTGAKSISNTSTEKFFLGFNLSSSTNTANTKYSVWKMENGDVGLIDANKTTVSVREAKVDPTDITKYILPYSPQTPYGTESNPILIKTADEFNRFISSPSEYSAMKDMFTQYGTTYINRGVFRLVSDLDFAQLSSAGINDVKLGTVRLSLVGGGIQGNGFVLKNLDISSNGLPTANRTSIGLFKSLEDHAYVKNLTIEVKNVSGNDFERVGVLAGTISNAYVVNVKIKKTHETSKVIGKNIVGGLAGIVLGTSFIKNVEVEMIVEAAHTVNQVISFLANNINISSLSIAGGVVGVNSSSLPLGVSTNFEQILLKGNFQVQGMVAGGILGFAGQNVGIMDNRVEINSGTTFIQRITSTNTYGNGFAGGIVGESKAILNHVRIEHTEIIQTEIETGIAAYYAQTNSSANRNGNEQIFSNSKGCVGGLVGLMSNGQIINSYAKVSVYAPTATYAGGIVGKTTYTHPEKEGPVGEEQFVRNDIQDVYSFGDVQSLASAGGIIGLNTAIGIRLEAVVALPYLRLKTSHDNFMQIVGSNGSGASVEETNVVSINSINNLVPVETSFLKISETFEHLDLLIWNRKAHQLMPKLSFGVPAENVIEITNTQDIITNFNTETKGKIFILTPENDGNSIAWPADFQVNRFYGTILSVEGKTVSITNVTKTMFKRAIESKFINFEVVVNSSVLDIKDSVFAGEIERCSFKDIAIKGENNISGNPVTTITQTAGNVAGMGVLAQNALIINEFEGINISNFNLAAPAVAIESKEIGVGGVVGIASGNISFTKTLNVKNVNILNQIKIVTPSVLSAGLIIGEASNASVNIDVVKETNASAYSISGKLNFINMASIRLDTTYQMKGIASFGGVVGNALNFNANNIKVEAEIVVDIDGGRDAKVSIGGFAGRTITSATISNSEFRVLSTSARDEIVAKISGQQLVSIGGAVGAVEGELSMFSVVNRGNMLFESLETGSLKPFVGGLIGKIDSSSKAGEAKIISGSAFTGIIFAKTLNGNIGGILGGDVSNNRAKTMIEFCHVGNSDVISKNPVLSGIGSGWTYNTHYYSGSISLHGGHISVGEANIGGIVGIFGKTGPNEVGSAAERNLAFGDIIFANNNSQNLNIGGIAGNASNNYINGNISFTSIKLKNQKNTDNVGAIVGKIGSNTWVGVTGKTKNIFSHQISLAVQEEENANLVNDNLYVNRLINERSLLTELDYFVNTTYKTQFPQFSYSKTNPIQLLGTKLRPLIKQTIHELLAQSIPNLNSSLRTMVLVNNDTSDYTSVIGSLSGMLVGDGYQVSTKTSRLFIANNGSIAGLGVVGGGTTTSNAATGLLVGTNNGVVMGCYATGNIAAHSGFTSNSGGLVGKNNGKIKDSFAHVNIYLDACSSNESSHGGLVGYSSNNTFIQGSYSTGVVQMSTNATAQYASFVGAVGSNTVHISKSWTSAIVMDATGQIISKPFELAATYAYCYYDKDVIGDAAGSSKNVKESKSNAELKKITYNNNTVEATFSLNHGYRTMSGGLYAITTYMAVNGNSHNIYNEGEMNANFNTDNVDNSVFKKYFLMLNISRSGAWEPVQATSLKFYGLGKTISKLSVTKNNQSVGLFSTLNLGTVIRLNIEIGSINGSNAGAFAGVVNSSSFIDCKVSGTSGTIQGTSSAGGMVGLVSSASSFTRCENASVKVVNSSSSNKTTSGAGGIVGNVISVGMTTFTSCSNKALITSRLVVGGIVGYSKESLRVTFADCTNTGDQVITEAITTTERTVLVEELPWEWKVVYNKVTQYYDIRILYNFRFYHGPMVGKGNAVYQGQNTSFTSGYLVSGYTVTINNFITTHKKNGYTQLTSNDNFTTYEYSGWTPIFNPTEYHRYYTTRYLFANS